MPNRGRGRYQKKIDVVHWTYGSFSAAGQAAGTVGVNVFPAQHLPETLLRLRGEWMSVLDGNLTPGSAVSVAVGLILVPEGTGTTVLWSPVTDGDAPWVWWDVMNLDYTEPVADVIASQVALAGRRIIDSKAMRKIRNTELQFVAEVANLQGTPAVDIYGALRGLTGS